LYYIVAVLINFTYIIKILTLRNWKCNNIILLLLSFLPNFPNTHHVLYFLSSCSFQMVLFYIFGCPLSRSFRLTLPLSYYRNRRAKAKIEEKYSEMPYGIEFFFSASNMGMRNMLGIWVFTRFHDNQNTNTHMWVHCFAVMEMEKGREAGRKRAGWERKGETIGHPGRFFNQVITVIRCKANVKSLHEIPMRRENTMRIHNWQAISYFSTLGTDLRRSWFCQNTVFILFKEIITFSTKLRDTD